MSKFSVILLIWVAMLLVACDPNGSDSTPTPLPPLDIAIEVSATPLPSPTATQTPDTPPTATPYPTGDGAPATEESEPATEEPVIPQRPTSTPYPEVVYQNDQWLEISSPSILQGGLTRSWLAYSVLTDAPRTTQTEVPIDQTQTLFLINPASRQQLEVAEIPATVGDRVYWSPDGQRLVYFAEEDTTTSGETIGGYYMLDFQIGLRYRLFDTSALNPRGIAGHRPVWSPDGNRLAFVLPTPYATDIFLMNADGTNFRNLTQSGSYTLFPAFSPNGAWIAYVSDQADCPTWEPNAPDTCDTTNAQAVTEGNLYILNLNTAENRLVTNVKISGTPRWVNDTHITFTTGENDPLSDVSALWLVDIEAGTAVQVSPDGAFVTGANWQDSAELVAFQRTIQDTAVSLYDARGNERFSTTEYVFPRFGFAADWSQDGSLLAIGGRNGQCPYGLLVVDPDFEVVTVPARNLLACDPLYAPDGVYLAFMGLRPGITTDGQYDVYIANQNGLGATNITSAQQGTVRMLGWVGGVVAE